MAEVTRQFEIILTDACPANIAECITAQLIHVNHITEEQADAVQSTITQELNGWFMEALTDQTGGLPEYENHRY